MTTHKARTVQKVEMTATITPRDGLSSHEAKQLWLDAGNRIVEDQGDTWIGAMSSYVLIGVTPAEGQNLFDFVEECRQHGEEIARIDFERREVVIKREDGSSTVEWIEEI